MHDQAKPLGRKLVELERQLDAGFESGKVSPEEVSRRTAEIATVQGQLRTVHLLAHLAAREVLTDGQIARYDRLRGYRTKAGHDKDHHG